MLDAKATIRLTICSYDVRIQVEDGRDSLIADGVRTYLQTGCISFQHAIAHE